MKKNLQGFDQRAIVRSLHQKICKNKIKSARHPKFPQKVFFMISLKARKVEAPTALKFFYCNIYGGWGKFTSAP